MPPNQIVTLTMNPSIDLTTSVDHVQAEKKLRCNEPVYEPGGGGINVSHVVKELGGESLACYVAGGPNGDLMKQLVDQNGLNSRVLPTENMTRKNITVGEEQSDQQFRFVMPGPELSEREWKNVLDTVESLDPSPKYIVASGSLPPGVPDDFYGRIVDVGNRIGARTIIDTSGKPLAASVEKGVFLLKPNMRELQDLVGRQIESDEEIEGAARKLLERECCRAVAVSLGAGGTVLVTPDGTTRFRSPTVPVRSKVGAGDSMVGGIVFKLVDGASVEEAVMFGTAAGAAAVMTPGTELCRKDDVERLFTAMQEEQQ